MPVKYIPYIPETIDGQAILDNFTRTRRVLRYRENNKVIERIGRGLPLYEVETSETVNGERLMVNENAEEAAINHLPFTINNYLIRGECLSACAYLKDKNIKVDPVYIDPPFASGADYARKVYLRRNPKIAEQLARLSEPPASAGGLDLSEPPALAGGLAPNNSDAEVHPSANADGSDFAQEEVEIDEYKAFEEKMYGDIWHKEEYLNWMYENLTAIRSVMSDTGSIYVHLDYHIGHYVKILLDEVFGEDFFRNEISWKRATAGSAKARAKRFGADHDSIYFYTKSEDYFFKQTYVPYPEIEIEKRFRQSDERGRYKDAELGTYSKETLKSSFDESNLERSNARLAEDIGKVIVYYIDIEDRAALDKLIGEKNETNVRIELRDLKEILDDVVLGDVINYDLRESGDGFEIEFNSFTSDRLTQKIDEYNQKRALQKNKRQKLFDAETSDDAEANPQSAIPNPKPAKPLEISENGLELIEFVSLDCTNQTGVWQSDVELKIDKNSLVVLNGEKTREFWNGKIFSAKKPLRLKVRNIAGDESAIEL